MMAEMSGEYRRNEGRRCMLASKENNHGVNRRHLAEIAARR